MTVINSDARAALEAAIDARINSGVRAASYSTSEDPEPPRGFAEGTLVERAAGVASHRPGCTSDDCDCPTLRPDPVSEKACNDAAAFRAALRTIAELEAEYQPHHRGKTPGIGPCPPSKCRDCWGASIERAAAQKRYTGLCRRCGDYRKRNGYPIPPLAIRALAACEGDWTNWRVQRALRSA
jgi:hypothetical protein